ncbi:MATE family efflux transporter [uncultured Cetobacterium sp.]|uniref:MATE family efflux transporter n=1 Tax=uncultured Cetobacterium sp. TaxID=527638 RepID=UPI00260B9A18|nr:MATE family efflux transporter [uncultured Cetobacterium sp.]
MKQIRSLWRENRSEILSIFTIALPTIVDMFVQTLLGFFDLIMVGRLGPDAIASVGLGTAPILTVIPIFFAISVGTTAMVSRAFGAKNYNEAKEGMSQSLILGVPAAFIVTFIFIIFGKNILGIISKNQPITDALSYLKVVSLGIPFLCFNIIFSYGFRSINKAKIPMINNTISIFSNILLNYIFIFVLNLGVFGAGIATTISRGIVTLIFSFLIIYKKNYCIALSKKDFKINKEICRRLLKVGLPSAGEQGIFRIGMLIFEAMVINLGTLQYAAHKIALTAESFSFNLGLGFSVAGTALVGQHLGARQYQEARKAGYLNMFLAMGVMTAFGFIFMIFPKFVISMFTKEQSIVPMASSALRIVSIAQPILAVSMVLSGALRGAGDTKSVLWITSIGMFLVRIPLTYLFLYVFNFGLNGAWMVMIVDLTYRGLACLYRFRQGKWRYIEV